MKKLLTLRNALICGGALLGLTAFILAAVCGARYNYTNLMGDPDSTLYANAVFGNGDRGAAVLPLIGAILVIVGFVCAVVIALVGDKFLKDEKIRKIALLAAAGLMVVGGVFFLFIKDGLAAALAGKSGYATKEDVLSAWSHGQFEAAGIVVGGVLGILGGAAVAGSQFVADKPLVK